MNYHLSLSSKFKTELMWYYTYFLLFATWLCMVKNLVNAEYIRIVSVGTTPTPTGATFKRKECCANLLDFRISPCLLHDIRINQTKYLHIINHNTEINLAQILFGLSQNLVVQLLQPQGETIFKTTKFKTVIEHLLLFCKVVNKKNCLVFFK